jgi:hypothetical protein
MGQPFMLRLSALALILLAGMLTPWTPAGAALRICASSTLSQQDHRRLYKAARATVPDGESWQEPLSVCRNRGSADAWLETPQRFVSEGAHEWWSLHCKRSRRDWTCEPPRMQRSATMMLVVAGQERRVNLSFDGTTSFAEAKELTSRAWAIFEDAHSIPTPCERSSGDEGDDEAWAKARADYSLDSTTNDLQVRLWTEKDVIEVMLFEGAGLGFKFRRRHVSDHSLVLKCWSEWVIVA